MVTLAVNVPVDNCRHLYWHWHRPMPTKTNNA